jgi:biotin carboxyl carrier protein
MRVVIEIDGEAHELWIARECERITIEAGERTHNATATRKGTATEVTIDGGKHRVEFHSTRRARVDGREIDFHVADFHPTGNPGAHGETQTGAARVKPPMPGRLVALRVKAGDTVLKGQVLFVLEAMKMQNEIVSPVAGRVAKVAAQVGDALDATRTVVEIEAGNERASPKQTG